MRWKLGFLCKKNSRIMDSSTQIGSRKLSDNIKYSLRILVKISGENKIPTDITRYVTEYKFFNATDKSFSFFGRKTLNFENSISIKNVGTFDDMLDFDLSFVSLRTLREYRHKNIGFFLDNRKGKFLTYSKINLEQIFCTSLLAW
jgi:hypothetical protein